MINKILALNENGDLESETYTKYENKFAQVLADDLNMANALSVLYEVINDKGLNGKTKNKLVKRFDEMLSLNLVKESTENDNPELIAYINSMLEERKKARKDKDFATADKIREQLLEKGIEIKDIRERTIWKII